MYGIGNTYDWEQLNQQQTPQIMQGLLGSTGEPNYSLDELISNGRNRAAQLGRFAQPINPAVINEQIEQQKKSTQQLLAQQQQQDAQKRQGLLGLAMTFLGGGIGKWL